MPPSIPASVLQCLLVWRSGIKADRLAVAMGEPTEPIVQARDMRVNYTRGELLETDALADPVEQFRGWFAEASAAGIPEINAMTLATADARGNPSARVVLLKEFGPRGFCFFTNYSSRKAADLDANPRAALVFFWQLLERQVRISGRVERVSRQESEHYFHARPVASQIGAWASRQSHLIASRDELERRESELEAQFAGQPVPLPDFWGGYRVIPDRFEFWQGRPGRLHDRLEYVWTAAGSWQIQRLQP
jgi:pyridoxamine 5'-phosphate oxidase